jgi:hypothetical protein
MLDRRMEEEDAVALALQVGLRSAELMERAIDYARGRLTDGDASTSASR